MKLTNTADETTRWRCIALTRLKIIALLQDMTRLFEAKEDVDITDYMVQIERHLAVLSRMNYDLPHLGKVNKSFDNKFKAFIRRELKKL